MSDEADDSDGQRTVPNAGAPASESSAVDRARIVRRETDDTTTSVPEAVSGATIGRRYKLLELIGAGGMGVVWMAEQRSPIRRFVAIKLIKAGMDSATVLARFDAERQALAMMDHPNIARIFDGGTTDRGHPFFVMELVKGVPLTRYCDDRKMPLNERLDLFVQVCGAVQHAHQKGIIHRDLKPGNLLVTEHDGKPVPKVIDFGLAKALGGSSVLTDHTLYTAYGAAAGTPQYMAPEQVAINALDVDTRTDIYALGVILYELLAGSTPHEARQLHQAAWEEIRRLIREVDPPRPSLRITQSKTIANLAATRHTEPARLRKLIAGDLDCIVMKALEKDRRRRYGTASDLASDLLRHIAGEGVLAAPPTAAYRTRKFVRKYRVALATTAAIVLSLVAGVMVSTFEAIRAGKAELNSRKQTIEANNQKLAADTAATVATKAQLQSIIGAGISANETGREDAALLWFAKAATMSPPFPSIDAVNTARLEFQRRRLWRPVAALPRQYSNIKELAFHCSDRYVLAVGLDDVCRLHDLNNDRVIPFPVPEGEVTAASWSSDGTKLAIATRTQGLGIWSFPDLRLLSRLNPVRQCDHIAWSPDSRYLVAAGEVAQFWDLRSPDQAINVPGCTDVWFVRFDNGAGSRVVLATRDGHASVFNVEATALALAVPPVLHRYRAPSYTNRIQPPFLVDAGRMLVTCENDTDVVIRNLDSDVPALRITKDSIYDLSVSYDAKWVAIGQRETLDIHGTSDGVQAAQFTGDRGVLMLGEFIPNSNKMLRYTENHRVTCGNILHESEDDSSRFHAADVYNLWVSPDARYIATYEEQGLVRFWETPAALYEKSIPLDGQNSVVKSDSKGMFLLPCGNVAYGTSLRTTRIYDFKTGNPLGQIMDPSTVVPDCGGIIDADISPDNRTVAISAGNSIQLWDWEGGMPRCAPLTLPSPGASISFDPSNSDRVVVACEGGEIVLVDHSAGGVQLLFKSQGTQFSRGSNGFNGRTRFTHDGRYFASWFGDALEVWDFRSNHLCFRKTCSPTIHEARFSEDGQLLALASFDHSARVIDVGSGTELAKLVHPDWVFSIRFSHDQSKLLTACRDGIARIWDWRTSSVVRSFADDGEVFDADFGPEERSVITATNSSRARIWDVASGLPVSNEFLLSGYAFNISLTPDRLFAAFGTRGSSIKIIRLEPLVHPISSNRSNVQLESEVLTQGFLTDNLNYAVQTSDQWYDRWQRLRRDGASWGGSIASASAPGADQGQTDVDVKLRSRLKTASQPHSSATNGAATHVTFVNRTGEPIKIFWIDADGNRKPYGSIAPGEQRVQPTYGGHVWLVVGSDDSILTVFEAQNDPGDAVIIGRGATTRGSALPG